MDEIVKENSYRKVARMTGLSASTIMRIHKQTVEPDLKTIDLIANAFKHTAELMILKWPEKTIEEESKK